MGSREIACEGILGAGVTGDTEDLDSSDIQPLRLPSHWDPFPPHAPASVDPNSQLLSTSPHIKYLSIPLLP